MKLKHPFIASQRNSKDLFLMTPALAAFLLEHYNQINVRPLDYNEATKRIARAILAGDWEEDSGQRIIFEKNTGQILDGQTRLAGIVETGKAVLVDVLWGVDRKVALLFDTHRRRSMGASFAGVLGGNHTDALKLNKAAAVARVWLRFNHDWQDMRFTRAEILAFYLKRQWSICFTLEARELKAARRAGFRAACAFYSTVNKRKAVQLFEDVTGDGSGLKANTPALMLRNYLLNTNSGKQHPEKQLMMDFWATLSMCWEYENGNKVKAISFKKNWP